MGKDLYDALPECRETFDEANDVLGYDLAKLCFEGPIEELTKSSNTQPAIYVHSVAAYRALVKQQPDLSFSAAAGLSSGEWAALQVAGVVSFADGLRVLQARGSYMQAACEEQPAGMLSVIGLDLDTVRKIADEAGIEVANLNSPVQTVLSGPKEGIAAAEKLAQEAGAKRAIPLNVAGAFHSRLMRSAAEKLGAFIENIPFADPVLPVVANVNGRPHGDAASIRQAMVDQVTSSVQWVETIEWIRGQDVNSYVECGPGKVLTGLVKRIDKAASLLNIQAQPDLEAAAAAING
jgi:[acyl-carrier-protein] S-malonyltransferase